MHSSGMPTRFIGICSAVLFNCSGDVTRSCKSVAMTPGRDDVHANALGRDFLRQRFRERRDEPLGAGVQIRPAAAAGARGDRADVDDVAARSLLPELPDRGTAAANVGRMFSATCGSNISSVVSAMLTREIWSPALLIRMSSRPNRATVSATRRSTVSGSRDIAVEQQRLAAASRDLRSHLLGFDAAAPVVHRDACAATRRGRAQRPRRCRGWRR